MSETLQTSFAVQTNEPKKNDSPSNTTTGNNEKPKTKAEMKKLAAAQKEGAKKGQDLSGLEDMGGVRYFHVALENCEGSWDLTEAAMEGANKPVDPNGEDRKGGAQNIGKVFLSASPSCLCIYLHVPEAVSSVISVQDWFDVIVNCLPKGHKVVQSPPPRDESSYGFAKVEVRTQECEGEVFPLKLRDEVSGIGFAFLRSRNVVPEDEESSDFEVEDGYEW